MPKVKISEYSATANSNTDVASINIDEGCAPSGINNAIRAVMGHLKDFQQGTNGDPFNGPVNGTVGATSPSTGAFTTLSASSTVTLSGGTANGVAYLNGSKVLTTGSALTFDGTNLSTGSGSFFANGTSSITGFRAQTTSNYAEIQSRPDISYSRILSSAYLLDLATLSNQPILFTINSTEQMRLTSTGLGIGNTSPASYNSAADNLVIGTSGSNGMTIVSGSTSSGYIMFADGTTGQQAYEGQITYDHTNNFMAFNTSGTERARIDSSGRFAIAVAGNAYSQDAGLTVNGTGFTRAIYTNINGTASSTHCSFANGNGVVGSISTSGSTTTYSTSSDYRLKNSITPMTGALAKVAALKPVTYKWNADGSDGEGFIAHELAEVVPQCVTGEKDALDADGNPKYQGIDTSFLVATLTAAIQELKAEFDAYKASHP